MFISRLTTAAAFMSGGSRVDFPIGSFRLVYRPNERQSASPVALQLLSELEGKCLFTRPERENLALYFPLEVEGWTKTLSAAAIHDKALTDQEIDGSITLQQLALLHYVIRSDKLEYSGEQAFELIEGLWQLTPGARVSGSRPLARLKKKELDDIKLVKFLDEGYHKVSLHFFLPEGSSIVGRIFGKGGQNQKHLSQVLAGGADIHPYVRLKGEAVAIEDAKLEDLLGGRRRSRETPKVTEAVVEAEVTAEPVVEAPVATDPVVESPVAVEGEKPKKARASRAKKTAANEAPAAQ